MLELVQNNYFFLLYIAAFILSIVRYRVYYDTVLKYFPILIAYTLLSEILGFAIRNFDDIQIVYEEDYYYYNTLIFNIFDFIFYLYFLSVYHKVLASANSKMFVKVGVVLFILVSILNVFLQNIYVSPQNYAILVGALFTVVSAFLYVMELHNNESIQITRKLLFWISIGIIVFHFFYPITMYIVSFEYDFYTTMGIGKFHLFTIALLYGCFIIGFIRMKRFKPHEI
ncbi:hypothetical protein [Maribacter aestuarii]|uniref:hypothetical protein n=1 Tax=Maribacter aestuarii TaxID=1130723 RepID=UPI00248B66AD|nr:hypothetical protein [Maribacter aestuarii]